MPLGTTGVVPAFPVEALPGWLGNYVAAVATATQTPPDLAGMLALAVLATVAAGAVEVQPRPGWREPLCLFVAVGMDAGARKSSVFTALTQPVADFERDQAAAALPSITETLTLRRIAEQAAASAETAASKAPADQQEERQAEAIARAAEAASLVVPPVPRWLVDDATPEALAGLLATYGRIALLSPEGDVFDQMAGRYNQQVGPNLGVYLKGHAGDLLKVDRRGRPPEYVERPCLTIGLTVQPEVLQGLAGRPGFRGRGLLARFLYSLPTSLVGRRQPGAPPVPQAAADRYAMEVQALAASLIVSDNDDPTVLTLDPHAGELLLAFERDLEPRLAAGSGDLAHLAGWAAKLAGATCRVAALLHLASHLRDGWAQPITAETFAGALRLADYLIDHACAVFDLMGADSRVDDARWLLDWIARTNQAQFSRRDAHQAARSRFRKATDLEPALALLEEHGYLRRVDADPPGPRGGRPPSPRFLVNPVPHNSEPSQPTKPHPPTGSVGSVGFEFRGDTSGSPR
jgi:replicative DNA helicase